MLKSRCEEWLTLLVGGVRKRWLRVEERRSWWEEGGLHGEKQ
jgi:hypothetical protein